MARRDPAGIRRRRSYATAVAAIASAFLVAPAPAAAGVPFQLGGLELNKRKGTASYLVKVPAEGKVQVTTAKKLAYTKIFFDGPGQKRLPIRARQGKPIKQLRAKGKLKVKLTITYVPQGPDQPAGGPSSKVRTITLRLNR